MNTPETTPPSIPTTSATAPIFEENNSDTGEKFVKIRLTNEVPSEIQRLVGLITADLRTALDYLACRLAIRNGRTDNGVSFPIAGSREEFEDSETQKKIKKLSPAARAVIRRMEPYKGGQNSGLWALNEIRKKGMHRALSPIGHTLMPAGGISLRASPTGSIKFHLPTWSSPDECPIVLTVKGDDNQYNIDFAVSVALANIEGFERQPTLPFLQQSAEFIGFSLSYFEQEFFSNSP